MRSATKRLVLTATLFAAWIGWLAYLAATTTRPIILSRPQFLVSGLDLIAELSEKDDRPAPEVTVAEVVWPREDPDGLRGKQIAVTNLPQLSAAQGWQGPGRYILALVPEGKDGAHATYQVVPTPPSPGFSNQGP